MDRDSLAKTAKELVGYRRLLAFAGGVYLVWWFAVAVILPQAFNPFISRFFVVGLTLGLLALSYLNAWVQRHLRILFIACVWLITLHYYYLFYGNAGDVNWVFGSYITVIAVNLCLPSNSAVLSYSVFVILLSLGLVLRVPSLRSSVFFPGLLTIVIQANIGLRARLKIIKNLAASNERFQLLFNSTFEGVLVHENQRIIDLNDSLARMLGYSRIDLLGKDALQILHPDERVLGEEKMKLEDVPPFETRGLTKDGRTIDIEVRAKNFEYEKRVSRLVTVREIGDRKRAEKERVTALSMAENVRVRDEFISIASHELKTPLSSLKLQTQIIERDLKRSDSQAYPSAKLHEFVALFNRQINRLTELVETMLDVSRISSGRLTLERRRFDLSALIREIVTSLQNPHVSSTSLFEIELPDQLMILADQSRIEQVVENILTNSIKYGEGKRIQVKLAAQSAQAVLVVRDHGMGIAPEFTQRIFERFERAISARNISGLGLGLYIARQIVEAHGGTIGVESQLHVGSAFTVKLPGIGE